MNWIDGLLIVLLLASVIIGSKKGLIRELIAFIVFFSALIASINYIDVFAVWVYERIGGSPLVCAFLSFVFLLAISYAAFKLMGMLFYKVANLKETKRRDQMGGALIGFLRGWTAVAFLTFLVFLLPMPGNFYTAFEASLFGSTVAKTIPVVYEGTSFIHPKNPSFMEKVENTLLFAPSGGQAGKGLLDEERRQVHEVLRQIDYFFGDAKI
ncbi:MAG TPA: CvpA family protein [Acidobacteriota bacterium]|nr:CvpA family protein [Acidobacteriota bacterium]